MTAISVSVSSVLFHLFSSLLWWVIRQLLASLAPISLAENVSADVASISLIRGVTSGVILTPEYKKTSCSTWTTFNKRHNGCQTKGHAKCLWFWFFEQRSKNILKANSQSSWVWLMGFRKKTRMTQRWAHSSINPRYALRLEKNLLLFSYLCARVDSFEYCLKATVHNDLEMSSLKEKKKKKT